MFAVGFVSGALSSVLLFSLGYSLHYFLGLKSTDANPPVIRPVTSARTNRKRTPKYVSEEEQARRESRLPPLDPS